MSPAVSSDIRHCIVGTAGHIDHGKSSLVEVLTGTNPDRLPEEKARGMTIELGFAHLDVAAKDGSMVRLGIVDVPGHERFVRTMVAGATGVDLAMLVVAADDGVMPQTREHIDILKLLAIETGLVAITKTDLVDADRIEQVREQLAENLASSPLSQWPIVETSVKTGVGLEPLRDTLATIAQAIPAVGDSEVFRLAIDRVFAVQGRGTVVTGSVLSGRVTPGTALELLPARAACKVREVQAHGANVQSAAGSQRAALNITGVERSQVERGMELATPGYLTPSRYVDVEFEAVGRLAKPIASHSRVRICMGTGEHMASWVIAGAKEVEAGKRAHGQLRFDQPVVASFGQRLIVRNETSQFTLGGGRVIRPVARRLRANDPQEIEALTRAASNDPHVRFDEAFRGAGFEKRTDLEHSCQAGILPSHIKEFTDELTKKKSVVSIGGHSIHVETIKNLFDRTVAFLKRFHASAPAEAGLARDRLIGWLEKRSAVGLGRALCERLEAEGTIIRRGPYVVHREFRPAMSSEDAAQFEKIVAEIVGAGFDAPALPQLRSATALTKPRLKMFEELAQCDSRVVLIAPQQFVSAAKIAALREVIERLATAGPFTLAQVRDALQLSRRVVQPLLEYADRIGWTRRVGDARVLQAKSKP